MNRENEENWLMAQGHKAAGADAGPEPGFLIHLCYVTLLCIQEALELLTSAKSSIKAASKFLKIQLLQY